MTTSVNGRVEINEAWIVSKLLGSQVGNCGRGRGKSDWPLKSACCLVSRNSMNEKVPKKRNLASVVSGTAFWGVQYVFQCRWSVTGEKQAWNFFLPHTRDIRLLSKSISKYFVSGTFRDQDTQAIGRSSSSGVRSDKTATRSYEECDQQIRVGVHLGFVLIPLINLKIAASSYYIDQCGGEQVEWQNSSYVAS